MLWILYGLLAFASVLHFRMGSELATRLLYSLGTFAVGTGALYWGVQEQARGGGDPYFPLVIAAIAAHVLYWWRRNKNRAE